MCKKSFNRFERSNKKELENFTLLFFWWWTSRLLASTNPQEKQNTWLLRVREQRFPFQCMRKRSRSMTDHQEGFGVLVRVFGGSFRPTGQTGRLFICCTFRPSFRPPSGRTRTYHRSGKALTHASCKFQKNHKRADLRMFPSGWQFLKDVRKLLSLAAACLLLPRRLCALALKQVLPPRERVSSGL